MFKRKIEKVFERWFDSQQSKRKALVVKGLRQIGKTTSVLEFAKKHFKNVVYINFANDVDVKAYFDGSLNIDYLIMLLKTKYYNNTFEPNNTVLIFDEIQECANARTSLKFFSEDGRYDVIATGSLMGTRGYNLKVPRSIPVGFETIVEMKPMDFEEFLWAKGINEDVLEHLKDCFKKMIPVEKALNDAMLSYFREYLIVGGMPEAVSKFVNSKDLMSVREVQLSLLESFKDDFGKHLNLSEEVTYNKTELARIIDVYNSIPLQLAKDNKKFKYSLISKNARQREYLDPILWLEQYGLVSRCFRLTTFDVPLNAYIDQDSFKIYVNDTGLFMAMLDKSSINKVITGDLGIYKGAIYENIIAEAFSKMGKELFYYSKNNSLEVDFVTIYKGDITAIEVKANNNKAKSLMELVSNNKDLNNFKLINGNIGKNDLINTLPLYMAYLID